MLKNTAEDSNDRFLLKGLAAGIKGFAPRLIELELKKKEGGAVTRVQDGGRQRKGCATRLDAVLPRHRQRSSLAVRQHRRTLVSIFLSRFLKSLLSASSLTSVKDVRAFHCS